MLSWSLALILLLFRKITKSRVQLNLPSLDTRVMSIFTNDMNISKLTRNISRLLTKLLKIHPYLLRKIPSLKILLLFRIKCAQKYLQTNVGNLLGKRKPKNVGRRIHVFLLCIIVQCMSSTYIDRTLVTKATNLKQF